jgi:hypothetical protein
MALLGIDIIDVGACCRCKAPMFLPAELYHSAKRSPSISFFCAYGHSQHYPAGESEETKLRRERDRLAQRLAEKDDRITQLREHAQAAERRAAAARGQVTKIKNRVGHGVCPCCNRTFENLARHMANQHPTFTAEAAE